MILILMLMMAVGLAEIIPEEDLHHRLQEPWTNRFLKLHESIAKRTKLTNCWICSHAPISSKTMPYLAVPLSREELFQRTCAPDLYENTISNWGATKLSLKVLSWVQEPWWVMNFTKTNKNVTWCGPSATGYKCFKIHATGGSLGDLPINSNTKVSFVCKDPDSSCISGGLLNVTIHDLSWEFGYMFGTHGYTRKNNSLTVDCSSFGADYIQDRQDCQSLKWMPPLNWCLHKNATMLGSFVGQALDNPGFILPSGIFFVCGTNAYKWVPRGGSGTCTLARVMPATWVYPENDIPYYQIPRHTLYRRSTKKAKPLVHLPWEQKFGLTLSIVGLAVKNAYTIEKLGELFDNITEDIFDALNNTAIQLVMLDTVVNQHALVLDYLTASQGDLCQVVGPACCHFGDNTSAVKIMHDVEHAQTLREQFRKSNSQADWTFNFPEWLSWLNPANWFNGLGGWIGGILQLALHVLILGIIMYICVRIIIACITKCTSKTVNVLPLKRGTY